MKIMQVSTPFLPVRDGRISAGTERIVYNLDRQLRRYGHETAVVAPADSSPEGRLYPTIKQSIGLGDLFTEGNVNGVYARLEHVAKGIRYSNNEGYDIVHFHDDNYLPFMEDLSPPS